MLGICMFIDTHLCMQQQLVNREALNSQGLDTRESVWREEMEGRNAVIALKSQKTSVANNSKTALNTGKEDTAAKG